MLKWIIFYSCLIFVFSSCVNEEKQVEAKAATHASTLPAKSKKATERTVTIYDINKNGQQEFVEVIAPKKAGDSVREAIELFVKKSHWKGTYRNLTLNRIGMVNRQATFIFSGNVSFENEADEKLFKNALEQTITHHYKSNKYSIQYN